MKLYIARHGQVRPGEISLTEEQRRTFYVDGDPMRPIGEPHISALGERQAVLLGERLRELDFHGKIYSSPYIRTMETAQIVADICGVKIYPIGWIREMMFSDEGAQKFRGSTIEELRALFPAVADDAELPYPWWTAYMDERETMFARVVRDFEEARQKFDTDTLLIGHGASVTAITTRALKLNTENGFNCNCQLTTIDTDTGYTDVYNVSHIPECLVTNNTHWPHYGIPEEILTRESGKVLHISDTTLACFDFFREMILTIRPQVILHTGDSVDEMKVGHADCSDADKETYRKGLVFLGNVYREAGVKRIYITLGNNDIEEWIREAIPEAVIVPHGGIVTEYGQKFALAHAVPQFTSGQADYFCFGHTFHWDPYQPESGTALNGVRESHLILPEEGNMYTIPTPLHLVVSAK